jgi:hypothetical protein
MRRERNAERLLELEVGEGLAEAVPARHVVGDRGLCIATGRVDHLQLRPKLKGLAAQLSAPEVIGQEDVGQEDVDGLRGIAQDL